MKVKLLMDIVVDGENKKIGDVVEMDELIAKACIASNQAEPTDAEVADAPPPKEKK